MKIPISSYSIVKFGDIFEKGVRELIKESGLGALKDAGLSGSDIEIAYIANCFALKTSNSFLASIVYEELGISKCVVISNGDASGAIAIQEAAKAIECGSKNAMVLGVEKMSDFKVSESHELSSSLLGFDEQDCGASVFSQFAVITNSYLHEFGIKNDDLCVIPIMNHKNAMTNEFAQFRSELTKQKIDSSPNLAEPLRMMECSSYCDGAAALIMSNDAKSCRGFYIGGAFSTAPFLSKRNSITEFEATKSAAKDAFKKSRVDVNSIALMELHDMVPVSQIICIEDMGFAKKGQGLEYIKINSDKINQSGGLKACGHAPGATGVRQSIDIIKRLKENEIGLTQTLSGCGTVSAINLFGGKNA